MAAEGTLIGALESVRRQPRWVLGVLTLGIGVLVLSLVPGWLLHNRVVGGEGYRTLALALNAWQLKSVPVLSLAAVTAALAGIAAVVMTSRRWLPVLVALPLGLAAAGLLPLSHSAHVTSVEVTPGWALLLALVALAAMMLLVLRGTQPTRRVLIATAAAFLAVAIGGAAGRVVQLQVEEAVGTHWSAGTYARQVSGQAQELALTQSSYASGDWAGTLEAAGTSIILTDDRACPAARGYYHVRSAGGDAILVEKVIDICADGARSRALEGVWTPAGDVHGTAP